MSRLERLEFWTDVEPAGGQRLAIVGDWLSASERVTLDGEDSLTLGILRDNPALTTPPLLVPPPSGQVSAAELNAYPPRVVRALYGDGKIVERRIEDHNETNEAGEKRIAMTAQGMLHELSNKGLCFREHSDQSRTFNFQASGLTIARHFANYIQPALIEAGQAWWDLGIVQYTGAITIVYDRDSPLAAFRKLVSAAIGALELRVRFDPTGPRYLIDFIGQIGGDALAVRLRSGGTLTSLGITRSAGDVATRMYGFGGYDEDLGTATLGQHAFAVTGVRTDGLNTWLTLSDPAGGPGPIAFDRQFVNARLQFLLGALLNYADFDILDSLAATQEVKVVTPTGGQLIPPPAANALYRIRTTTGAALSYVERPLEPPAMVQPLGIRVGDINRPEALGVINILGNPMLRNSTPVPTQSNSIGPQWNKSAANTSYVIDTFPQYWKTAGHALRATFSGIDGGIFIFNVAGIEQGPVSYWADCLALRDFVKVKLAITFQTPTLLPDGSTAQLITYPDDWAKMHPGLQVPQTYQSTRKNVYERLGIENCHDATAYPVSSCHIRIHPRSGVSTVVNIDAAQVTNTRYFREIVEGSGANVLLQDANERLKLYSDMAISINMEALDLSAVQDADLFQQADFTLGGPIILTDEALGVQITTRCLGWERDHLSPEKLRVQIASAQSDIVRILASPTPSRPPASVGV